RLLPSVTLPTRVSHSVMILKTTVAIAPGPIRTNSFGGMLWTSADIDLLPNATVGPAPETPGTGDPPGDSLQAPPGGRAWH
ncbi:MAG: hypothetical protein FD129_2282, partial [bacterium]